ncbi:MAG: serine/threonine-protein kinase [Polyangiales bacterium]
MPRRSTFEQIRSLGVGALAESTLARLPDGAMAVCKRMHRHCASDPSLVAMMEHEARLLARFDHPAIPRLLDFTTVDGAPWMITQYLDGEALDVARPLGVERGAEVVLGLLDVLGYVHAVADLDGEALEVVHRDVAPGNVLLRRDGTVALVDFSIATSRWRRDPDRGVMKGTRGYMAPEVVTGEREADARADLFAAGVLLWELTVGERLYAGDPLAVMTAVVESPAPRPSERRPGYPPALEAAVLRALSREVDARYADARAMAAAIEDALAG